MGKLRKAAILTLGLFFLTTQVYLAYSLSHWVRVYAFSKSLQVNIDVMNVAKGEQAYKADFTLLLFNPRDLQAEVKYVRIRIYLRYDSSYEYIWILEENFLPPMPLEPGQEVFLRLDDELPAHKTEVVEAAIDSAGGFWIVMVDLSVATKITEFTVNKQFLIPLNLTLPH